jgi:hypothetical protein
MNLDSAFDSPEVKLIAVYQYDGSTDSPAHLIFSPGDIIFAKPGQDGNSLWFGRFGATFGWFPPSYCRLSRLSPSMVGRTMKAKGQLEHVSNSPASYDRDCARICTSASQHADAIDWGWDQSVEKPRKSGQNESIANIVSMNYHGGSEFALSPFYVAPSKYEVSNCGQALWALDSSQEKIKPHTRTLTTLTESPAIKSTASETKQIKKSRSADKSKSHLSIANCEFASPSSAADASNNEVHPTVDTVDVASSCCEVPVSSSDTGRKTAVSPPCSQTTLDFDTLSPLQRYSQSFTVTSDPPAAVVAHSNLSLHPDNPIELWTASYRSRHKNAHSAKED